MNRLQRPAHIDLRGSAESGHDAGKEPFHQRGVAAVGDLPNQLVKPLNDVRRQRVVNRLDVR